MSQHRQRQVWAACCGIALLCSTSGLGGESRQPDYLAVVQRYADAMTRNARDVYGAERTPLFATTCDRRTGKPFQGEALTRIRKVAGHGWGIRPSDRSCEGANPMHHQNFYQVLYALTAGTGKRVYAMEADAALTWFFTHCQSPTTGLLAWGEHLGWNFFTDGRIHQHGSAGTHEFYRPWVLWERSFQLAPRACDTFALGLWQHQIADHKTGDFSRHAAYDKHDHYEAITRADTLALALLHLWAAQHKPDLELPYANCER